MLLHYGKDGYECIEELLKLVNKYKLMAKVNNINGCRHCGKEEPKYCEKCYQELISENCKLQMENIQLCNDINSRGYWPSNPMKKYEFTKLNLNSPIADNEKLEEGYERYLEEKEAEKNG